MSERVMARKEWSNLVNYELLREDFDAPSVQDIVEALHDGRDAAEAAMNAFAFAESPKEQKYADIATRLNNLLFRLEE